MNERQLIEHIVRSGPTGLPGLLQGAGDDCAVLSLADDSVLLLTMDTLLEGVHFDPAWHTAEKLGWKTVAVNISDIAAMGGRPSWCLLSLGLPPGKDPAWVESFSRGLDQALRRYGCQLIGGDTVSSPAGISLSLTVGGVTSRKDVLYRSGARAGDTIWVSGPLGLAAAGLDLFRQGGAGRDLSAYARCLEAHLAPKARLQLGQLLAGSGLVHAMMDCSDGLATDLAHMCKASRTGARVVARQLVVEPVLAEVAALLDHDPLDWILRGGEDYELLFTVSPGRTDQLLALAATHGYAFHPVGSMTAGEEVILVREAGGGEHTCAIGFQGFDHFAAGK